MPVPVLMLLFIVVPAVELGLLIEIGGALGALPTIGLIILTGVVGAALAKRQGLSTLRAIQTATSRGEMPVDQLVDGALILFAGALLVTPGVLTDAVGFLCLIPGTRVLIKRQLKAALRRFAESGQVQVVEFRRDPGSPGEGPRATGPRVRRGPRGPVVDVEAEPPSSGTEQTSGHRTMDR